MSNFLIILFCFALGSIFKNVSKFPSNSAQVINTFIIYISLPALVFTKLPELLRTLDLHGNWWVALSMPYMTFLFSALLFAYLGKKLNWSKAKTGALILTCGLGNTSFVGFPLLEALLGKESIPFGVLIDQPGSFFILSSFGIIIASIYSGEKVNTKIIFTRLFTFPPFLSLLLSSLWFLLGTPGFALIHEPFEKISATLVPLSLFAVGFQTQFNWNIIKRRLQPLVLGLTAKLIAFPFIFYFLYWVLLQQKNLLASTTILESAMATMITAAVVAGEYNLDSELANLMVSLSIPISIITVPLFKYILLS